jgi:Raf kinase inhibitor-like YbhB/YbcL family protein
MAFALGSSAFRQDEQIPSRHTCDGADVSPPLTWTDPPDGTGAFALVVDDPDAPSGTFTHWLLADIAATDRSCAEGHSVGVQGTNDFGRRGYGGPCPPKGHGRHRYRFHLHALSRPVGLPAGISRSQVDAALQGLVLDTAVLTGWYERGR